MTAATVHQHVEAARVSIAGARLRKTLMVITPSEYEALTDVAMDASGHYEDDRMQAALARWKENHVID